MSNQAEIYTIVVDGTLDAGWTAWLCGWAISPEADCDRPRTTVQGSVPDQAALRGILNRLWDLNLSIVSVKRHER